MKNYKTRLAEIKREREEALRKFYELLELIENNPVRKPQSTGFPFNLLEQAVQGVLTLLERTLERLVTQGLKFIPQVKRKR